MVVEKASVEKDPKPNALEAYVMRETSSDMDVHT